jgi:hypothetical protein
MHFLSAVSVTALQIQIYIFFSDGKFFGDYTTKIIFLQGRIFVTALAPQKSVSSIVRRTGVVPLSTTFEIST